EAALAGEQPVAEQAPEHPVRGLFFSIVRRVVLQHALGAVRTRDEERVPQAVTVARHVAVLDADARPALERVEAVPAQQRSDRNVWRSGRLARCGELGLRSVRALHT